MPWLLDWDVPDNVVELPDDDMLDIEVEFEDVTAFDSTLEYLRDLFLAKREDYGNNLENAKRFPLETIQGLGLKCTRCIREIENDGRPKLDTLRDLVVYGIMLLMGAGESTVDKSGCR